MEVLPAPNVPMLSLAHPQLIVPVVIATVQTSVVCKLRRYIMIANKLVLQQLQLA